MTKMIEQKRSIKVALSLLLLSSLATMSAGTAIRAGDQQQLDHASLLRHAIKVDSNNLLRSRYLEGGANEGEAQGEQQGEQQNGEQNENRDENQNDEQEQENEDRNEQQNDANEEQEILALFVLGRNATPDVVDSRISGIVTGLFIQRYVV